MFFYNIFVMLPMNLRFNFEKPFMYWHYTLLYKILLYKSLKVRFIVYKTIMLEVIFQHKFFQRK